MLRIAAYILMRLIGPLEVWTWRVRIFSMLLTPGSITFMEEFLMAKPNCAP